MVVRQPIHPSRPVHPSPPRLPSAESLRSLEAQFDTPDRLLRFAVFSAVRRAAAALVESLVVADRLLFLQRHGCRAHVVRLFDTALSPRCLALVAEKLTPAA